MLIILIKKEYELVNSFFQFLYLLLMENSSMSSASEYRPKDFNEMIGQDAIVKTLSNAIDSQKIPQALLFCGPRGVGKTSCARILAKKINDLDENFEYNIFELDAASNNSVEDIRNITEQIRIPPQYGKFKVYIIDEVHMLSNAAFNAFLKSLEEPPPHVVFILATTEKNKIIPTILSRCQIYDFKKVDNNSIIGLLHKICKEKKIKFDDSSLQIIAEKSDGSIRDSLSMFDRLVSFTNSNLTIDEVTSNLNILDYESYFDLSSLITNKDIPGILSMYDKVYNRGVDDVNFLNGISKHFRELLINKLDESDIKDDLKIKYKKQGDDYSDEDLILMIDIVNECLINYQKVNDKRIHTEICLMKLASLDSIKKKNSLIKTSEFSNKVIGEDNKLDEALEVNKKEIKLFTSNNDEVSSLSIASLNFKKSENIEEEDNIELPNDDFTENDIRMAWKKFCDKEKVNGNNNMLSLLNMNDPVIENNSIIISTINKMNQKEVKGYKNKIQAFISKELNNYSITVDVSLDEVKQKKNFVDSKDKLDALIKENNNISLLINEFKLRI